MPNITITLTRTGAPPITFDGQPIVELTTQTRDATRYHDASLFVLPSGAFVLALSYLTSWDGETDHHAAYLCPFPADVVNHLLNYDPLAHLAGWPPLPAYAERQQRLRQTLTERWQSLVSRLLASRPEFAQRLD
jgi:hypothetical protein